MELTLGVTAHVDAGKTTLCEQILRHGGVLRRCGRVDHGDTFMDGDALERERGITIFCEQASFTLPDLTGQDALHVTLMDTPGHVDFSGETERALSVLDAALLVVSCAEGVQSHTVTLFHMLLRRKIPVLLFLNKTDREGASVPHAMAQMQEMLSTDCLLMTQVEAVLAEELAARDEMLLQAHFAETAQRADYLAAAQRAFSAQQLFPVFAGSALLDEGVDVLLKGIAALCTTQWAAQETKPFAARVYRVRRLGGVRYIYVKAEAGQLAVRESVDTLRGAQKVSGLFAAQGKQLMPIARLHAGETAALTGIDAKSGECIGAGCALSAQEITPLMSVQVEPVPPLTQSVLLSHLRELEDEDPLLGVRTVGGLSVDVMGRVQIQVLERLLLDRFGDAVRFLPPRVIHRETIAQPVVGIGHYEPLRHYAEVWLRLSPGAPGSGVTFDSAVSPNVLAENWQRLIKKHVLEREHPGVLTGSALTDVQVTLLTGRAHLKHTEGGDFREAVYRAIRHGLMQAQSILLEPQVRFELAFPSEYLSRVTGELIRLSASLDAPQTGEREIIQTGVCRAEVFWDFPTRFAALTRGRGRIASNFDAYVPCTEQTEAVSRSGYDPLADETAPTGSVFCTHGAGVYVNWMHVREWAHCELPPV